MTSPWLAVCAFTLLVTSCAANCGDLLQPSNGIAAASGRAPYAVGTGARVFCKRHYKFRGRDDGLPMINIRCLRSGRWESPPECVATTTCDLPPQKDGGDWVVTGNGPGDSNSFTRARLEFRCHPGKFFAGPKNFPISAKIPGFSGLVYHCNENVRWSGPWLSWMNNAGFRCLDRSDCNRYPSQRGIANGQRSGSCCAKNDVLTYTCNPGFHLIGSDRLTCVDGRWDNQEPSCTDSVVCDKPSLTPGTDASFPVGDSFQPRTQVTFTCQEGYYFGMSIVEEASDDEATYEASDGEVSYDYGSGAKTYKHVFDTSPRALTCTGPSWNDTIPKCKAFTCAVPAVSHGSWNTDKTRIQHGEDITISCDHGYSARGDAASMICDIEKADENDGMMIEPPTCNVVKCANPVKPENGFVSYKTRGPRRDQNRVGAIIEIGCYSNYQLYGSKMRKCGASGRWTGGDTTCQPTRPQDVKDCPIPVIPYGGRKQGDDYNDGDQVTYKCYNAFIQRGPSAIVCNGTLRQWVPAGRPSCESVFSYDDPAKLATSMGHVITKMKGKETFDKTIGRRIILDAEDGLDLTFLIDASGSITKGEFENAVDFVKLFVEEVGVSKRKDGARIAVATFATNPKKEFNDNNGFHTYPAKTVEQLKNLLDALNYSTGETNINGALKHYQDNMHPFNLMKRPNALQYLLLLSDGRYNTGGNPERTAKELKLKKVEIFAIKVGTSKNADEAEKNAKVLKRLSSEAEMNINNDDPHYFQIQEYKVLDYLVQHLLNGSIDFSECGRAGETGITAGNIIGGDIAKTGAWPWMVAIMELKTGQVGEYQQVCGGTLLDREWVLTAAHCFQSESYDNAARIMVKIGVNNITQSNEKDPVNVFDALVADMYLHQDWIVNNDTKKKGADPNYAGDIALLRLAKKVKYSNTIRPICLAKQDQEVSGMEGVVAGWGKHGNESVEENEIDNLPDSNELRQVRIPVVTPEDKPTKCVDYLGEKIICAGSDVLVKDSCRGDSGGPLMIQVGIEDPKWHQIGIVSNGVGCARLGPSATYGKYTDVRQYLDWIQATMQQEN